MAKKVDLLRKQLHDAEKKELKTQAKKRENALTERADFLLEVLANGHFEIDPHTGLLEASISETVYDDSRNKQIFGEWLINKLREAKILLKETQNSNYTPSETVDNYESPSAGFATPHYSFLAGHKDTKYEITIDPSQKNFEQKLMNAVLSVRLEEMAEKTGADLENATIKKGLLAAVKGQLESEMPAAQSQRRG